MVRVSPPAVLKSIYTVATLSTTPSTFNFTFNEATRVGYFNPPFFLWTSPENGGGRSSRALRTSVKDTGLYYSLVGFWLISRGLIARYSRTLAQEVRGPECVSFRSAGRSLNIGSFHSGWVNSKVTHKAPALRSNSVLSLCYVSATLPTLRSERFGSIWGLHRHQVLLVLP